MSEWSHNDDEPDPFTSGGDWAIDIDYYEQTHSSSYGTSARDPYGHNQDPVMDITGHCGGRAAEQREMERHVKSNHRIWAEEKGFGIEKFVCDMCDAEFTRKDNLKKHKDRKHTTHGGGHVTSLPICYNVAVQVFTFAPPYPIAISNPDIKPFIDRATTQQGFPAVQQYLNSTHSLRTSTSRLNEVENLLAFQLHN
ncbi:hypothetical protein DL765_005045 [Monosporascus sp. GIB2]|nr:hypothetical protein DL765_005045 [Monosporascus sp. GIB2]